MKVSTSVVQLQPGMYILRHPGGGMPPLSVTRTPGCRGECEVLTARPQRGTVLEDASDCIVMRVGAAPVNLLVAAFPINGAAVEPAIKVDRISLEAPAAPVAAPSAPAAPKLVIKDKGISLVGHVELQGDVVASEGQLLGQSGTTRRIEGFQIMWPDRPEGVDLAYNVVIEGVGATPVVATGKFVGTRRQAKRITEATFALVGPNASRYQLDGTAHFSGGFQIPVSSGVALSGPSGMEHLTGLGLRVVPAAARAAAKPANVWEESPRTKVFSAKKAAPKTKAATTKKPATKAAKAAPSKAKRT